MSDVILDEIPGSNVCVLSGPSHAEEVGRKMPTTIVIGAFDKDIARYVQNVFMNNVFRVYTSPDMLGIEIGAALQEVLLKCPDLEWQWAANLRPLADFQE